MILHWEREIRAFEVLGELSAAVLYLHEHTRGLDSVIDSEG